MKENKLLLFAVLLLIFSFACSVFTGRLPATPTQELDPIFEPVTDPLVIEPATLPEARKGVMYEAEVHITHNVTPVSDIFIKDGTLPAGLELVFMKGQDAAKISGIPKETGIFSFKLFVGCFGTMVSGQTLETDYQISVGE
ncbi:MAG: hypothetical protein ABI904_10540 [Chloroflexota bacterium]